MPVMRKLKVTRDSIDNDLLTLKSLMSMDMSVPIRILSPDTTYISRMAQLHQEIMLQRGTGNPARNRYRSEQCSHSRDELKK